MSATLKGSHNPSLLSCLKYGKAGPSCQQVRLISEQDGQSCCIGLAFISIFSKNLATIISESQSVSPTVTVPVDAHVLDMLLAFLSLGELYCKNLEEVHSVGKAALILGIGDENWTISDGESNAVELVKDKVSVLISVKIEDEKMEMIEDIKQNQCDDCGDIFNSEAGLNNHNQGIHSVLGMKASIEVKCSVCLKHFKTSQSLDRHVKRHFQGCWRCECHRCKASFNRRQVDHPLEINQARLDLDLETAFAAIKDAPVPACPECGREYKTKGALLAHWLFRHSTSPVSNQCPICKKILKISISRGNLGHHFNLHFEDEKRNCCDECGKSFYEKKSLANHRRIVHSCTGIK